jgi:hypothetical protein
MITVGEMRMRGRALIPVLVVLAAACENRKPQPLGKLPRSELASWAADCPSEIQEKPAIRGRDPAIHVFGRDSTFQQASHRFVCDAPGWAVYVDSTDRVVGMCVDNNLRAEPGKRDHLERARPLIGKHWGPEMAASMTTDSCLSVPIRVGPFLRWSQDMPKVQLPDGTWTFGPNTGALWSCCWEVAE